MTLLTAGGIENRRDPHPPNERISSAFLRSVEVDYSVGLFLMEIEGRSDMADIPGQDALTLMDSADLASFLASMDTLTFTMTGYRLGERNSMNYAQLSGTARIDAIIDPLEPPPSSVPDPGSSLLLLGISLAGLSAWRMRRQ